MIMNDIPVIDITSLDEPGNARGAGWRLPGLGLLPGDEPRHRHTRSWRRSATSPWRSSPCRGKTKQTIARTADNPWGYFDQELTKNTPDWKEIFDYGPAENRRGRNQLEPAARSAVAGGSCPASSRPCSTTITPASGWPSICWAPSPGISAPSRKRARTGHSVRGTPASSGSTTTRSARHLRARQAPGRRRMAFWA